MKKRVAVFANGWSDEYLSNALEGITACAKQNNIDLYLFIEYAAVTDDVDSAQGDINIINLPDLTQYDGIVLMGNTLNNRGELGMLYEKISKINRPTVCLEYELDGVDCICTDNYTGMKELCEHLINFHNAKNIAFISGDEANLENKERKRALEDTLRENGLSLNPDSVIMGGWSYYNVRQVVPEWLKTHALPDAFVCANDVMAMGLVFALNRLKYSVPDDVLVTGFDNIISAQTYSPIITTVDRGWEVRSRNAMEHLIELMNGGERKGLIKYPSRLSCGESCGCRVSAEVKKSQARYINSAYSIPVERTMFDWHLTALDTVTTDVKSLDEVHDRLCNLFEDGSEIGYKLYEGDTFCINLDESFVESISGNTTGRCIGYGNRMDVLFALRDGVPMPRQSIDTSYIFPVFGKPDDEPSIYMMASLHSGSMVIGYVVFKNSINLLSMYYLNNWLAHVSKGIMRAKQSIKMELMNQRLNEMSIMDELSGLLNRKGYEKRAIPLLEKIRAEGKSGVLMVVDINKMKLINDRYGHLQGDLAIRLVSKAISSKIPEGWYGVRYGGDEFVVLGENIYLDDGGILQNQLCDAVKSLAEDMLLPFELTISVGTVIINPNENVTLDEYFKKADNAMYEMKKILHGARED